MLPPDASQQSAKPRTYFTDTHCHIHDPEFFADSGESAYERALNADIRRLFVVGTDLRSSEAAVRFAQAHEHAYAVVGIHPHEAFREHKNVASLRRLVAVNHGEQWLVGIGEIGLDYFYLHSPKDMQQHFLRAQLDIAAEFDLPVSFHVRSGQDKTTNAFNDFWPIFDAYDGIRGVLHSFTDSAITLKAGLDRGLLIGVNGISTFASDVIEVIQRVPLENIVFETDAPYLTPKPHRGKINEPLYIQDIATFHASERGCSLDTMSAATEANVDRIFFAAN